MRFIIFRLLSDSKFKEPSKDESLWGVEGEEGWFRVCGPPMKDYTISPLESTEAFISITEQCIFRQVLRRYDILYIQNQFYVYDVDFVKLEISDKRVAAILNTFL